MSDPAVVSDPAAALKAKRAANLAKARAAKRAAPPAPVETLPAPASVEMGVDWSDPDGERGFIDQALSRALAEGDAKVKYLYQRVVAAVQARRVLRDVMGEMSPGEDFPQWATLHRNDSTGQPIAADRNAAVARVLAAGDAPLRPVQAAPQADILSQLRDLLNGTAAAQNAAPPAPAARPAPLSERSAPSREAILGHVTGGRPMVPVGEGPKHGVELA